MKQACTFDIDQVEGQPLGWLAFQIARHLLFPERESMFHAHRFFLSFPDDTRARSIYRTLNSLGIPVAFLPPWEILPGESSDFFAPNAAARSQSIEAIVTKQARVVIATHKSAIQKIPGNSQHIISVQRGYRYRLEEIMEKLVNHSFVRVPTVDDFGQIARRGDILDIYCPGGPYRLDFFDEELERITRFDVDTQRSLDSLDHVSVMQHREYQHSPWEIDRQSVFNFADDAHVLITNRDEFYRVIERERKHCFSIDPDRILLGTSDAPEDTIWLDGFASNHVPLLNMEYEQTIASQREERFLDILGKVSAAYLSCRSPHSVDKFLELSEAYGLQLQKIDQLDGLAAGLDGYFLLNADFEESFYINDNHVLIADRDLFALATPKKAQRILGVTTYLTDLAMLQPGDYVVHVEYGVGIFRGIENLSAAGTRGDFLKIEYSRGDVLYVPNDKFHLVQKYIGSDTTGPKLDRMGSKSWEKRKSRARKSVEDIANSLTEMDALRRRHKDHTYLRDSSIYDDFVGRFPFEETSDQLKAIDETLEDMYSPFPMDRLICGDVGYGKTEVALRAAMKAVESGYQTVVLAPTTILVEQHYRTFQERFIPFGVKVEMVSRFRTAKENRLVLEKLASSKVDIVIGTHKLLGKGVSAANPALLVIDEEQRFGVKHKEKLKELKANIDVLTLTATPIPRTLHMALGGIRKMSVIETPPKDRRSIKTEVIEFDENVLRQGLMREFHRGGQVYFLHNRVETINSIALRIQSIIPEARVAVAHGQMGEANLERVMLEFSAGEHDILVCSSIVESGLDVPQANTIFINRADTFGLAQIYQLRGRVGRSERQAFCYLIIPPFDTLHEVAQKRIKAIEELSYLGAGFRLATYDLEIRGAGNLLGSEQSGQIASVGFEMYTDMLRESVRKLTGEMGDSFEPSVRTEQPAFIPEEYVDDMPARLSLYKRMSVISNENDLDAIAEELRDRFGPPPAEVQQLLEVCGMKMLAIKARIDQIYLASQGKYSFTVNEQSQVNMTKIIQLAMERKIELDPQGKVSIESKSLRQFKLFIQSVITKDGEQK
ncbi:transcription-repair coupling factor [Desulfurispira natronophila]|uniref:Transcription-repair-coupling factor n=1 Tax=Desulfurispira natronophila TaxID=682562 RepID=A0A7W7Y2S4_9BACT|nr:transcription-repair coupling factor [Desulfurispira natronophila]MBB5020974.1 transcription-repair coupling factor (superfamily II helicase) [Desulfurispira natronophila]